MKQQLTAIKLFTDVGMCTTYYELPRAGCVIICYIDPDGWYSTFGDELEPNHPIDLDRYDIVIMEREEYNAKYPND